MDCLVATPIVVACLPRIVGKRRTMRLQDPARRFQFRQDQSWRIFGILEDPMPFFQSFPWF
jgi:hypothetical protein